MRMEMSEFGSKTVRAHFSRHIFDLYKKYVHEMRHDEIPLKDETRAMAKISSTRSEAARKQGRDIFIETERGWEATEEEKINTKSYEFSSFWGRRKCSAFDVLNNGFPFFVSLKLGFVWAVCCRGCCCCCCCCRLTKCHFPDAITIRSGDFLLCVCVCCAVFLSMPCTLFIHHLKVFFYFFGG